MPVPRILSSEVIAQTRFFKIEAVDLEFENGVKRTYERLPAMGEQGVIVVAVNDDRQLMLIEEYACGFHEIQLTLPKGLAEQGEQLEEAANRELAEEIGFAAKRVEWVKRITLAPGHMGFTINVMFATGLYEKTLPADEPEPPILRPYPLSRVDELIASDQFNEARAIAALTLCKPYFDKL